MHSLSPGRKVVLSEGHDFFCCDKQRSQCVWMMWDRGTRRFLPCGSDKRVLSLLDTKRVWNSIRPREQTPTERKVAFPGLPSTLVLIAATAAMFWKVVTWLILPVVICLSQRLSHACLSINNFVLWNCEWLIKSVIVYLMLHCYMDNCGNSRANTCNQAPTPGRGVFIR